MIRYSLHCDRGHTFESWFQSSSAYESQEKRKLVNCPVCGSAKVERAIMAPRIVSKKGRDGEMVVEKVARPKAPEHLAAIANAKIEDLESGLVGAGL